MPRPFVFVALVVAVLALSLSVPSAHAVGYWNVPGNVAQWWGYGWGGGHHACLVLGPVSPKGAFAHHHRRLPYAPQPDYGCYDGCTYHYDFRQSSQFVPDEYQPSLASPTLMPEVLPIPQTERAP